MEGLESQQVCQPASLQNLLLVAFCGHFNKELSSRRGNRLGECRLWTTGKEGPSDFGNNLDGVDRAFVPRMIVLNRSLDDYRRVDIGRHLLPYDALKMWPHARVRIERDTDKKRRCPQKPHGFTERFNPRHRPEIPLQI
ncbi:hypothetical protein ACVMIH_003761 [Bradyrhizobium sp. USDA 4503]